MALGVVQYVECAGISGATDEALVGTLVVTAGEGIFAVHYGWQRLDCGGWHKGAAVDGFAGQLIDGGFDCVFDV